MANEIAICVCGHIENQHWLMPGSVSRFPCAECDCSDYLRISPEPDELNWIRDALTREIIEGAEYRIYYPPFGGCLLVCVQDLFAPGQVMFSRVTDSATTPGVQWERAKFLGMRAAAAVIEANK